MKEAFEKIKERLEACISESYYRAVCGIYEAGIRNNAYNEALSIVSEVEAEYINKSTEHINKSSDCSSGWIPVEERLPENDDEVLVWYEYLKLQGVNIVGRAKTHGIGYYYKPTNSWLIEDVHGLNNRVIAWMPLPEPFKGV